MSEISGSSGPNQNPLLGLSDHDLDEFLPEIFPEAQNTPQILESEVKTDVTQPSLRRLYNSEIEAIRSRWGDLETIRQRLGLSRRKVCQLLLVDPSAWTRWTRNGQDAPAYIYRSLEWYLHLSEKNPAVLPRAIGFGLHDVKKIVETKLAEHRPEPQFVQKTVNPTASPNEDLFQDRFESLKSHAKALEAKIHDMQQIGAGWKALLLINTLVWIAAGIFLLLEP